MAHRPTLAVLLALGLLGSGFLLGAQAQETNDTAEDDDGSTEEDTNGSGTGGTQSWVDCWDDDQSTGCEAVAASRAEADDLLAEAEADGRVPFALDDPYTDCHAEERDGEVRLLCTHVDSLVDCWEEDEGPVCEAWGETVEEARAKFDREAGELPFSLDDPDVTCEEERHEQEAIVFCFEEPEHETRAPDDDRDVHDGPAAGEPDCTPRPEQGVVACTPPPACEGQLGATPECQPPPECEIVDPDTVTCPMRDGAGGEASGPQPDCEPVASDPNAMVCTPPSECEGQIGETAACTPPPECEPQSDGTFLCKLDGRPAPDGDAAPSTREEEPAARAVEGLDEDLRAAVQDALDGFREELETLRAEYEGGKAELAERYEQTKDELRADYRECLDELGDDAERVEVLEQELACKEEARQALQEEREILLAERDLLREDLLSQADTKQFQTCQNLQESLHSILMDHGLFDTDLEAYLGPGDLGLCAGILIDAEIDGADVGGWGGGEER